MKASVHAATRMVERVVESRLGVLPETGTINIKRPGYNVHGRYGLHAGYINYYVRVTEVVDEVEPAYAVVARTAEMNNLMEKIEADIDSCFKSLNVTNQYETRR